MRAPRPVIPSRAVRKLITASLLVAACSHPAPSVVVAPTPAVTAASDAATPPPARVVRHREPVTGRPPEFDANARTLDVDHDGVTDLVRPWPTLPTIGGFRGDFVDVPPAVLAHGLAEGRFALDDDLTRAALRSVCPSPPPAVSPHTAEGTPSEQEQSIHAQTLFLEGFCRRVWGASVDEAVERVRASATAASPGVFADDTVRAVIEALRAFPVPQELEATTAEPIALVPDAPTPPTPPAAPTTAPDPRCAVILRANAALIARARHAVSVVAESNRPRVEVSDLPTCVASPGGVWSVQFKTFTVARGDEPSITLRAEVVWRPTTGAAARPAQFTLRSNSYAWETLSIAATGDYDGDGVPEVFVRTDGDEMEGAGSLTIKLYTARDGQARPYANAERFERIVEVTDADRDGRDDLVLPSPWTITDSCGLEGITHDGPRVLAHALADGTFSTTDDVARAWAVRGCVRERHQDEDAYADVIDVACARIRGASAEQTVAALARRWTNAPLVYSNEHATSLCLALPSVASQGLIAPPFEPVREGNAPTLPAAR